MAQRAYTHSAYWYAKKYGWTHSDKTTYTGRYLDFVDCSHRFGNGRSIYDPEPVFNPLIFATYLAADIGIAGGDGCALLFKKGEIVDRVPEEQLCDALLEMIMKDER